MNYRDAQPLYRAAGWDGVLPLPPRAKAPPPEGFTGRGAPYPDERQLGAWLNGGGDGNLALRLPEGVIGIDVDAYDGKPGAATLAALESELGPLPPTVVSSARPWPSGIRLYRVPPGRAWRNPGPGIEVIHAGWRYMVAFPSIHPNGNGYTWREHRDRQIFGNPAAPLVTSLPWLPEPWVKRLDAGEALPYVEGDAGVSWVTEHAPRNDQPGWTDCPVMIDSASRHVDNMRSAGGGRHDAMLRGVAAVVHLAANGHRGAPEAIAALREVFEQTVTDRSTWGEFNRALLGAVRKEGVSELFQAPPCRCGAPAPEPVISTEPVPEQAIGRYLSVSQLRDIPKPVSFIDGALDGSTVFAILGRSGIYKSFFAIDWLCCLATGTPWLGRQVRQAKVLYVVGEGVYELGKRLAAWQDAHNVRIGDDQFTVLTEPVNLFRQGGGYEELKAIAPYYGVIVFDTLQRMSSGGDLNLARDASPVIEALDRLRKLTDGGSVGYVGHTGKSDQSARGSSVLEDDVDIVWRLKLNDDGELIAELVKRKDGPSTGRHELRARPVAGTDSIVLEVAVGLPETVKTPAHALAVLELLNSPAGVDGFAATTLAQAVGVTGGAIYRPLNWLLNQGWVSRKQAGQRVSWVISPPGREKLAQLANISR
jgi:AAA domain/Bifunctional DNA primase/polymerase, N-terminal